MTQFSCVGLDIRTWPIEHEASADATVWPRDEELYQLAQEKLGIKENSYQLLYLETESLFKEMQRLVAERGNAVLLSVTVPTSVFNVSNYGSPKQDIQIVSHGVWRNLGYDVCDINGFFSFAHMDVLECPLLFRETELLDAFELTQVANILVKEHRPFVVVGLSVLDT